MYKLLNMRTFRTSPYHQFLDYEDAIEEAIIYSGHHKGVIGVIETESGKISDLYTNGHSIYSAN